MDDKFNELVMSIKDAGRFLRGESEPSRTFEMHDSNPAKNWAFANAYKSDKSLPWQR